MKTLLRTLGSSSLIALAGVAPVAAHPGHDAAAGAFHVHPEFAAVAAVVVALLVGLPALRRLASRRDQDR